MAISSHRRRSSDLVLVVAGLLLVGLIVVPAVLPSASAQTEGGPTTTSSTPVASTTSSGESTTTTTESTTTTTAPPPVVQKPDVQIRRFTGPTFAGNNVYASAQVTSQTREGEIGWRGATSFVVKIENDGSDDVPIDVDGLGSNANYTVTYHFGAANITNQVVNGTYTISDLSSGSSRDLRVDITGRDGAVPGSQRKVWVRARSGLAVDRVFAVAERPLISAEQDQIRDQINTTRRQNGRAPLAMNAQLAKKAQAWAERLARNGRLSHSTLTAGVPQGWTGLAENVGYGSTLPIVHNAFKASSGHLENMLGPYNFVGTGDALLNGTHWIVHVFMRR